MAKERQKASDLYRSIADRMAEEAGVVEVVENRKGLHGRAFVEHRAIEVPPPNTLRRLYIFAHECGHVARGHKPRMRPHRREYEAESWAREAFERHGLRLPPASDEAGRRYVAWMIRQALNRGARNIDPEAYEYARDFLPYLPGVVAVIPARQGTDNQGWVTLDGKEWLSTRGYRIEPVEPDTPGSRVAFVVSGPDYGRIGVASDIGEAVLSANGHLARTVRAGGSGGRVTGAELPEAAKARKSMATAFHRLNESRFVSALNSPVVGKIVGAAG